VREKTAIAVTASSAVALTFTAGKRILSGNGPPQETARHYERSDHSADQRREADGGHLLKAAE
jgi:hypothetical protein